VKQLRPSSPFLAAASLALLLLSAHLWLSLAGGCEDVDDTPCHAEYRGWLVVAILLVVAALAELVRRGLVRSPPGAARGPRLFGAILAGVVLLALGRYLGLALGLG
jgi:hypothetical protein